MIPFSARTRFEKKLWYNKETTCWEWTAYCDKYGYGHFRFNGKMPLAHRFAYELYVAPIPEGLHILHKCNNCKCVNPEHLYVGTPQDNADDRERAERAARQDGEYNKSAKLTQDQVRAIRTLYDEGVFTQKKIGQLFGVGQPQVSNIINNVLWKEGVG